MKFLCDSCKAKYQIPDEKIAGRTLRMKCRKCGHNIIIRGAKTAGPKAPAPKPQAKAPAPGSALGASFRQGAPLAQASLPQWHVAINDVPVGPIRAEEVQQKIQSGAVSGENLVWKEGFDAWRPLKDVSELAALLPAIGDEFGDDEKTVMAPSMAGLGAAVPAATPAPSPAPAPVAPPPKAAKPVPKPAPQPAPKPAPKAPAVPEAPGLQNPELEALAPAVKTPSAPEADEPIFDEPVFATVGSAPAVTAEAPAAGTASEALPAPPAAPKFTGDDSFGAPEPEQKKRAIPMGALIAMIGAGAFGITLAAIVAPKLLATDPAPMVATAPAAPAEEPAATPEPETAPEAAPEPAPTEAAEAAPSEESEAPADSVAEGTEASGDASMNARPRPTMSAGNRAGSGSRAGSGNRAAASMNDNLTDEQRRMLERLGGSGASGSGPSNIDTASTRMTAMNSAPLDGTAVRRVVGSRSNQLALRRCYERAIRGVGDPPSVRIDVDITVAGDGRVSSTSARGDDFGGLSSCIERSVRRFRFPPSSGGRARFPVVFNGT